MARRARPVIKTVAFSESEWSRVQKRMEITGSRSFGALVRSALLDGEIVVKGNALDTGPIGKELSRIGNNVNQIARQVNVHHEASYQQMVATRALVSQIQQLLTSLSQE